MARWKRTKEQVQQDIKDQSKVCCVCEERKDFTEFYNAKNKSDSKGYRCKSCDDKAKKRWANNNEERSRYLARNRRLKFCYGIDIPEYNRILEGQDGRCAICGKLEEDNVVHKSVKFLSVDHDHTTGKIRGLLCNQCNRGIGMLGDTVDSLRNAIRYLDTH